MKKSIFILMALFCIGATESQAQSLLDLLKSGASKTQNDSAQSSSSNNNILSGLGNVVSGLLGTSSVNSRSLVGTWNYTQPSIVFESEDMLTNVSGIAAGKAAEQKLQGYLDKIGFTAGSMKITFDQDGKGSISYGTKNIPFQWSVEGADLTINLSGSTLSKLTSSKSISKYTSFKVNCKLGLGSLQLSFKADKLAEFISKIVSTVGKSNSYSTIGSIAAIISKVDGMYLGLTFGK